MGEHEKTIEISRGLLAALDRRYRARRPAEQGSPQAAAASGAA